MTNSLLDKLEANITHYAARDTSWAFDKLKRAIRSAVDDACYDMTSEKDSIALLIDALLVGCRPLIAERVRSEHEDRAIANLLRKSP